MKKNTYVRDTLIRVEDFNALSPEKQSQIKRLIAEFNNIGYIDARTELGPSQYARMGQRQRQKIVDAASGAFQIEAQIKRLLIPDVELRKIEIESLKKKNKDLISQCENYISFVSNMTTSHTKSGKLKKSYARGIEDNERLAKKAYKENSHLNVELLIL